MSVRTSRAQKCPSLSTLCTTAEYPASPGGSGWDRSWDMKDSRVGVCSVRSGAFHYLRTILSQTSGTLVESASVARKALSWLSVSLVPFSQTSQSWQVEETELLLSPRYYGPDTMAQTQVWYYSHFLSPSKEGRKQQHQSHSRPTSECQYCGLPSWVDSMRVQ